MTPSSGGAKTIPAPSDLVWATPSVLPFTLTNHAIWENTAGNNSPRSKAFFEDILNHCKWFCASSSGEKGTRKWRIFFAVPTSPMFFHSRESYFLIHMTKGEPSVTENGYPSAFREKLPILCHEANIPQMGLSLEGVGFSRIIRTAFIENKKSLIWIWGPRSILSLQKERSKSSPSDGSASWTRVCNTSFPLAMFNSIVLQSYFFFWGGDLSIGCHPTGEEFISTAYSLREDGITPSRWTQLKNKFHFLLSMTAIPFTYSAGETDNGWVEWLMGHDLQIDTCLINVQQIEMSLVENTASPFIHQGIPPPQNYTPWVRQ